MAAASTSTIVLITGANQGIGFATAKKLAKENPGYRVLLGSRDAAKGEAAAAKLKAENLDIEAITIDVDSDESITAAAVLVASKFGRLDVLINNAGISNDAEFIEGKTSIRDVMYKGYNTNVFGAMQCFETFKLLLEKSDNPRVVFLSSAMGSFGATYLMGAFPIYRSTKTALNMLVNHYAVTYKEKGFKINLCCPGYLSTNLTGHAPGTGPVEEGAIIVARLATLEKDGDTGTFSNKEGPLPW